jgi:hypothetical protein
MINTVDSHSVLKAQRCNVAKSASLTRTVGRPSASSFVCVFASSLDLISFKEERQGFETLRAASGLY